MEKNEQRAGKHSNEMHDDLTNKNSLAIIVAGENSSVLSESSNNSMCQVLFDSENFVSKTDNRDQKTNEKRTTNETINPKSKIQNPKYPQWRSLLDLNYRQACVYVLQFVEQKYLILNLAWLERQEDRLETLFARGDLKGREMQLIISANDKRLLDAAKKETSLELRERQTVEKNKEKSKPQTISLFPITVGGKIQSALIVGDKIEDENTERQIARFCQSVAAELEILRLREQLSRHSRLERAVEKFNESLKNIDSEDFWSHITNIIAELMRAERSSLLVYDEKSDTFIVKGATGIKADLIKGAKENLGERVAKNVLNGGKAIIVANINEFGLSAAPEDWLYKSSSFISYPIAIDGQKIGVLNVTDKADGEVYNNFDLEILHAIAPQLAVLIDRANLKNKAVEFEQLSVTDALTGLLNRRYLEERITEEIKRSNRHSYQLSFMMIDVDNFKSYNDNFGHTEGDKALQIVGICLKDTLRGADVAARYGGEEFSVLLPQTTLAEAARIGERIRKRVESTQFSNRQVTISIGVASFSLNLNSSKKIISAADKALYKAKNRGRNNVQIYKNL
ncbi:MAG: sensor domain-containing diguanylate cyclase [Acidobacteriota bacterium]|nr:sensor domain-containing diguanylate cyclase [Acidobacteriota bacterium]